MPIFNIYDSYASSAQKAWIPADQITAIHEEDEQNKTTVCCYSVDRQSDYEILENFEEAIELTKKELKDLFRTTIIVADD